jgi:hypothetical protein
VKQVSTARSQLPPPSLPQPPPSPHIFLIFFGGLGEGERGRREYAAGVGVCSGYILLNAGPIRTQPTCDSARVLLRLSACEPAADRSPVSPRRKFFLPYFLFLFLFFSIFIYILVFSIKYFVQIQKKFILKIFKFKIWLDSKKCSWRVKP